MYGMHYIEFAASYMDSCLNTFLRDIFCCTCDIWRKVDGRYQQKVVPGEVDEPAEVFLRAGATLAPEQQRRGSVVGVRQSGGRRAGHERSILATQHVQHRALRRWRSGRCRRTTRSLA